MTWVFYQDHRSYLEGATSAGDIVCTYNPVNGPKLVGIWGYKGSPYTKIFLKILWGLLFLTHPVYSFLSCTVTRDQRNWRLNGSVGIRQVILRLFLLCQVKSDFEETWYGWQEGYKVTEQILNICINYANYAKWAYKTQWSDFSQEALVLSSHHWKFTSVLLPIFTSSAVICGSSIDANRF